MVWVTRRPLTLGQVAWRGIGDSTVRIVRVNSDFPEKGGPLSMRCGLRGDLQRLNARLRALLSSSRRTADDDSLKPFRGLVVSDEEAASLLEDLDQSLLRPDHDRQPAS